jgi:hypothetical protein
VQMVVGTGTFSNIRGANMRPISSRLPIKPKNNQTATGLFVTRLSPRTTTRQLILHLRRETGYSIYPEKLATKYDTYSSWYIRANSQCMRDLLNPSLWPKNTLVKPYYT